MTEQEFWRFLDKLYQENGRATQVSGWIGPSNNQIQGYLSGHAILPNDYDKLQPEDVIKMGEVLLREDTSVKAKEAIMMILAHQPSEIALTLLAKYCLAPDKGLEFFAEMALEECSMWND